MQRQILRITAPDDFEIPEALVRDALQRYLEYGDRWRHVHVEALDESRFIQPPFRAE